MAYLLNQVNQILLCCGDLQCINEYSALDTKDGMVIKETGIWLLKDGDNQEWLGSSPAGLIEQNGILKTVIEIKNLFLTEKGLHLTYTPNHAGNVLPINKTITITMTVVWTPIGTKVFLIERDDAYKGDSMLRTLHSETKINILNPNLNVKMFNKGVQTYLENTFSVLFAPNKKML